MPNSPFVSSTPLSAVEKIDAALPAADRMQLLIRIAVHGTNLGDRQEAAHALSEHGNAAVEPLRRYVLGGNGASYAEREAALHAIRILGHAVVEANQVLTEVALREKDPALRSAASWAINCNRQSLKLAEQALTSADEAERRNAIELLRKFYEDGVRGLGVAATTDSSEELRLLAVKKLGEIAVYCHDPVRPLHEAANDPSPRVRSAALWELRVKGDRPMGTPSED